MNSFNLKYFIQSLFFVIINFGFFIAREYYNPYFIYYMMNISLIIYVFVIIYDLWKKINLNILLNPLALSLIINFLLFGGGLTNFFLIEEDFSFNPESVSNFYFDEKYLVKAGLINSIALAFTVLGYYSSSARKYKNLITHQFSKIGSHQLKPGTFTLVILLLIGYYIKIILMQNGLYGRLLSLENTTIGSNSNFLASQLSPLNRFSLVPFVFICYYYFRDKDYKMLFFTALILEFLFAFLTGARGPVMATFIVIFIINFYATKKVSLVWVIYGSLILLFAFTIANNFKYYVLENSIAKSNPIELLDGFIDDNKNYEGIAESVSSGRFDDDAFGRMNYMGEMSAAIAYKDEYGLRETAPPFLRELLSIPLNTVIPRSVSGVSSVSWGDWFRYEVLNRGNSTSAYNIAFSPVAFFYFTGGVIAVILGFLIYGILLRALEDLPKLGFIGFLLFVLIGSTILQFKTSVPDILVPYFRYIIFVPLLYEILPKKLTFSRQ